ncbi:ATP-binding protein [Chitinophaga sp. Cy-1792]|uniref:ATP-binding protein n=1 Tax=Chitinophaga sp. Cy-1792 TaxID=2608339 RepID=UPI00141F1818|nr:ATP-binding protein [Chitinophaga sp. Cy-1792]
MVVILTTLFLMIYMRKRTSERIGSMVNELSVNDNSSRHLSKASQLLYQADNNFRLYTVTFDRQYFTGYHDMLKGVKAELDSALADKGPYGVSILLANKARQMDIFTQCSHRLDSLLQLETAWPAISVPAGVQASSSPTRIHIDTIISTQETATRSKKKLLGRIRDAIANKSDTKKTKQVAIVKHTPVASPHSISKDQLQSMQAKYDQLFVEASRTRNRMNNAEADLVATSNRLFAAIQELLLQANDATQAAMAAERSKVQAGATISLEKIKHQGYWEIPLILVLATIIIYGIMRLYRYDLALLRSTQQAERLARQKSEFAATVSHELRTPIQSLLGYSQQLNREYKPETVSAIRTGAEMLLQVVNNVLEYTKIETHKLVLKQEKFSPRAAIEEVCQVLQVQSELKSLQMTVNIYFPTTLQVSGDAFRLKQVITNLVANAIKYTDKGAITITAAMRTIENGNCLLEVTVTDTGIGIHNRDLPQLFDAFTQASADSNASFRPNSSGLGLHIAKKIIDLHDGKIYVKSIHGKGSTFFFEIKYQPIVHSPATRKITVPVNINQPSGTSTNKVVRILVVEDSVLNQKLLSMMLDRMQVYYKIAGNGEEALALFEEYTFDIILTDIDLPGMDGIALTAHIRAMEDKKKAAVTIIAITGNVMEEDIALYLKCGFNDYIMKPYRDTDIQEKLLLFGVMA